MNWNERTSVIKGDFAEKIVHDYLESKGFIIYTPSTSGAHAFDKLAIRNKKDIIIAECKAKARRNHYEDTGIDLRHYKEYKTIEEKYKIPVFLFFIDEMEKRIYGNWLTKLEQTVIHTYNGKEKQYPSIEGNIIYFPLVLTTNIQTLTDEQVLFLKSNSIRKHEYIK